MQFNDIKLFEKAYYQYYEILCRYSMRFLNDRETVEEIVDDVFFNIWKQRNDIIITSIKSYLIRSVRNRCLNELKSQRHKYESSLSSIDNKDNIDFFESLFTDKQHPLGEILEKELENNLVQAINNLPTECQRVFKISRFEHKKYEEIATQLGISVNTVKYHIKNALKILQESMSNYL